MALAPISFILHHDAPDWATNDQEYVWGPVGSGDGTDVAAHKRADGQLEVVIRAYGYEPITLLVELPAPKRGGVSLIVQWLEGGKARLTLNGEVVHYAPLQARPKLRPPSVGGH